MTIASNYFNAAVNELSEFIGPMASIVMENVFAKANLPVEGTLTTAQIFVLSTFLRSELPKHLDTYAIVRRIEQASR